MPAFFSPETAQVYKMAFDAKLGLDNIPNHPFYERRNKAAQLLAAELRPPLQSLFARLFIPNTRGNAARYVIVYALAGVSLFFAGLGTVALCQSAGLGDTATMLVTVPSGAAAGALVIWLLLPDHR